MMPDRINYKSGRERMKEYHKIRSPFNRDSVTNKLVSGSWSRPEFEYLAETQWIATEKVDGTNVRVIWSEGKFSFAGKTDRAQFHVDLLTKLQETFNPLTSLFAEKFGEKQVCLYGEGYGAGIQKGGIYRKDKDFILFDVWIDGIWLERGNVEGIAEMVKIQAVPIIKKDSLIDIITFVQSEPTSTWGNFEMEGVVARPTVELLDRRGERIITKIKVKDFRNI